MKRRTGPPPPKAPASGQEPVTGEVIWGLQTVMAELEAGGTRIFKVVFVEGRRDGRLEEVIARVRSLDLPLTFGPREALDRLTFGGAHQGVVARLAPVAWRPVEEVIEEARARRESPLLVALDELQDPHNLGAVARSAEALGAHALLLPRHRSAAPDGAAAKAAAGALSRLPLCRAGNLARTLEQLRAQGLWIIGTAAEEGTPAWQMDLTGPLVLVIGGEQKGVRPVVRKVCDALAVIPLPGATASLNASVAAGVMLYEIMRQRAGRSEA